MVSDHLFEDIQTAFASKTDFEMTRAKYMLSLFSNKNIVNLGASLTSLALTCRLPVTPLFKLTVYNHFCGGETFNECAQTIDKLNKYKVGTMLNYGVELKENEDDFEQTINHTISTIRFAAANKSVKSVCTKVTGFGRFSLLEKLNNKEKLTKAEEKEYSSIVNRLDKICNTAAENNIALYIDAEESWIQEPIDNMVNEMMEKYNKASAIVYNTIQLYRNDRLEFLVDSHKLAREKGYILGVKIVRGAYMEKERERAEEMGYSCPIYDTKKDVDQDFNDALRYCLENLSDIAVCVATQSEESSLLAVKEMNRLNIPLNHSGVVFSQLYGMGDNITFNLAKIGCNACKYLPYGPVKEVIPYLIRRAQENTSISGQIGRELSLVLDEIKRRRK